MLDKTSVMAIVVTYHPDTMFAERFERLRGQVDSILVVDNNSGSEAVSMLRELAVRLDMELVLNSENLGVATALNIGMTRAIASGYGWALLFDQDTVPGDEMFDGLSRVYEEFPRKDKLAIIGSNYLEPVSGKLRFSKAPGNGRSWQSRTVVITSGSLVSLRIYETLGPLRDEYFIDCVDHEYCLRARSKGFEVIATVKPLMTHGIGRPTPHRLPWRATEASNHSSMRRYYMIRNHVDLAKRYLLGEPAWVVASLWARFKSLVSICLFEDDRVTKMRYSWMGLVDGLRSNFGRQF